MDFTQMGTVLAIVVIVYLICIALKAIPGIKNEYIPVFAGLSGAILGAIGLFVIPDFPADDIMNAIATGIVSGLAATGANQVYKQLNQEEGE